MQLLKRVFDVSIGLLILRLGAGGYMATHGWGKLQMLLAGEFDKFGDPIGLGNHVSLICATGAEFVCAVLVMLGLATRVAAVPVVFTMAVAAFAVHGSDPWTAGEGYRLFMAGESPSPASKEPALGYLIAFLTLVFTGAGRFSIDAWIVSRWNRRRASELGDET